MCKCVESVRAWSAFCWRGRILVREQTDRRVVVIGCRDGSPAWEDSEVCECTHEGGA